jgi:hypothetical protein
MRFTTILVDFAGVLCLAGAVDPRDPAAIANRGIEDISIVTGVDDPEDIRTPCETCRTAQDVCIARCGDDKPCLSTCKCPIENCFHCKAPDFSCIDTAFTARNVDSSPPITPDIVPPPFDIDSDASPATDPCTQCRSGMWVCAQVCSGDKVCEKECACKLGACRKFSCIPLSCPKEDVSTLSREVRSPIP